MIVMIVERASASLRGELTRWLIEPRPGVFVGKVSGTVRDKLWDKAAITPKASGAVLIYSATNEQGFQVRVSGFTRREPIDWDGLTLIRVPRPRQSYDIDDDPATPHPEEPPESEET